MPVSITRDTTDLVGRTALWVPSRSRMPLTNQSPGDAPSAAGADAAADEDRTLRRRARLGMLILGGRSGLQHIVTLAGTLALARLLSPSDFGTFAIVHFALAMCRTLGEVGLAASLVQKPSPPTDRELSTLFWAQLALTSLMVGFAFAAAGWMNSTWPDLPPEGPNLFRVLSISLLLNSLRAPPFIMLERELRFFALSAAEFVGTVAYYGIAVTLAWRGLGAQALVAAVLAQTGIVLVATYWARPWRPRWVFDASLVQTMLRFGLPYQGKVIGGLLNNAVTPVLAGTILGRAALGLNNFALTTAWFPLQLVTIIARVSFPLYSRLAENPKALGEELRFSLRLCGTTAIGFSTLFFALGPQLVEIVYHPKWLPSMPSLYIYSFVLIFGFMTPIAGAVFDGLGRPQVMFRLSLLWTTLNWVSVGAALSLRPDVLVFAGAFAVHVVFGSLLTMYYIRKEVHRLPLLRLLGPSFLVGVGVAATARVLVAPQIGGGVTLLAAMVLTGGTYLGLSILVDPDLRRASAELRRTLRNRKKASQEGGRDLHHPKKEALP